MRSLLIGSLAYLCCACSGSDASPADGGGSQADGSNNGGSAGSNLGMDANSGGSDGARPSDAGSGGEAGPSVNDSAVPDDAAVKVTCDPREILCKAVETPCPEGQVHQVIDRCYGPCVAITTCPCESAAECPHDETYTCWNTTGHCNYYGP